MLIRKLSFSVPGLEMLFSKGRKQRRDLENYRRRVADITNPNSAPVDSNRRTGNRFSRIFPVLISPWEEELPLLTQCTYGLTKIYLITVWRL